MSYDMIGGYSAGYRRHGGFGADAPAELTRALALYQKQASAGNVTLPTLQLFNPQATQADVDAFNAKSPQERQASVAQVTAFVQALTGTGPGISLNATIDLSKGQPQVTTQGWTVQPGTDKSAHGMSTGAKVGVGVGIGVLVLGLMAVTPVAIYFIAKGLGATKGVAMASAAGVTLGLGALANRRQSASPPGLSASPGPRRLN